MRDPSPARFLIRVRRAVALDAVLITAKADDELLELGWERSDVLEQLRDLQQEDFLRVDSSSYDDQALVWVFCPPYWDSGFLWVRLQERGAAMVVVVSFHQAEGDPWKS